MHIKIRWAFLSLLPIALAILLLGNSVSPINESAGEAANEVNQPLIPQMSAPLGAGLQGGPLQADPAPHQGSGPVTVPEVKHDTSPPLRDIQPIPPVPHTGIREMPEPQEPHTIATRPPVQDPVVQRNGGGLLPSVLAPAPSNNFDGVNNIDGVYPPDTNGDVGPNHYVQWVNLHFQIWNKSGVSVYGPAAGNTLWSGFGGSCQTRNDGDPVVLYDSIADRWVMTQFTASNPYGECIAVSTTPDPTGSYYRYFFQFSTSVFYDYPKLGVWPDGYYLSANRFGGVLQTFQGPSAIVFDRSKMLNGQAATFQQFNLTTSYGTLLPADFDGTNLPAAGEPNFFAEIGSTALHLWKFHVDWTTSANSTFTGPTSLTVAAYNQLCPSSRSCVPQPSTTVGLDGLGDRLMHRLAYRKFADHEALVVSHNVNAASSGTNAGVRWYEVRNPNGTATLYQQGTYAPDANNRWLGSVAMDSAGNIALGYSVSSSSVSPSIRYTGRLAGDTLGLMTQGETTLIAGSGSQTGTGYRWGDYANMSVDPFDDCTFWFTTEYIATTGTAPWRTRIGSFKFPSCGSTSPTATPTSAGPTNTPTATSVAPTATNTATSAPPTATRTATNTPSSGGTNVVVNPGFESGPGVGWTQYSSNGFQLIDTTRPHTGSYSAYECDYNSCTEYVQQQITVPANATLTYWRYMTSSEGTTTAYDYLRVRLFSTSGTLLTTLRTWSNTSTRNAWLQDSISLSGYAGQTVNLRFVSTTDFSLPSAFFIDDVSVK